MSKRPKFILHLGANKTGTSSLQKFLYDNVENLKKIGYIYPKFELQYYAHHKLAYSIAGHPRGLEGDWLAHVKKKIQDSNYTYIFSSELFLRNVPPKKTAQLFPPGQTKVIIYLRDHLSYMMSWFAQAVQERDLTASFADYCHIFPQHMSNFVIAWEEVYGKKNVLIRQFSRNVLLGGDIREDFIRNLQGANIKDLVFADTESNPSLSGNLLYFKRLLNLHMTTSEAHAWPIPDEIGAFANLKPTFNGRFHVTTEELQVVNRLFDADRRNLNARGLNLPTPITPKRMHLSPDYNTLREDLRFIKLKAIETNKEFCKYAERIPFWSSI